MRIAHEISVSEVAALEPLSVPPVVIARVIVAEDEANLAVAVDLGAARRVAHGPVEIIHAVKEYAGVGHHPKAVVTAELDDERLIRSQLPAHVRNGAAAAPVRGCIALGLRRKRVDVHWIDDVSAVLVRMIGPIVHEAGHEPPGPIHAADHDL